MFLMIRSVMFTAEVHGAGGTLVGNLYTGDTLDILQQSGARSRRYLSIAFDERVSQKYLS